MKNSSSILAAAALSVCQIGHAGSAAPDRLLLVAPAALNAATVGRALAVAALPESTSDNGIVQHRGERITLAATAGRRVELVRIEPGTQASLMVDRLAAVGIPAELDQRVGPAVDLAVDRIDLSDPSYTRAWWLGKVGARRAWLTGNGAGVVVAVLDTGVDGSHPDLVSNMVPGWNVYDNTADTRDVYGHGTQVAGVVAATANNGIGGAGLAWGAKIMPIRISAPDGYAYWSTVAQGLQWAADHGARVANISFNGLAGSLSVQAAADAMRAKGGVVVVAAGNSGRREAIAESASLIAVSATDANDAPAGFTSFGPYVDLAAPGTGIYTTARGGGYSTPSGTSFAAPIVAAAAALAIGANPGLTPEQIDAALTGQALDLAAAGRDEKTGTGRVRTWASIETAVALLPPPIVERVLLSIECPTTMVAACVDK